MDSGVTPFRESPVGASSGTHGRRKASKVACIEGGYAEVSLRMPASHRMCRLLPGWWRWKKCAGNFSTMSAFAGVVSLKRSFFGRKA